MLKTDRLNEKVSYSVSKLSRILLECLNYKNLKNNKKEMRYGEQSVATNKYIIILSDFIILSDPSDLLHHANNRASISLYSRLWGPAPSAPA